MVAIAARPELFENVVPRNQTFEAGDYAGMFHFVFWRYGKWEHVVVDDRLPFNTVEQRLCFGQNKDDPNEFWNALCEKAYAKIHGSYQVYDIYIT